MSNLTAHKIIAVDFDGCLVTNKWPDIGEPIQKTIDALKREVADGAKIILWTCREGELLAKAVLWCAGYHGINFDTINQNLPEIIEVFGGDNRKIFANEYWDDRAVLMSEQDIGDFSDGYHTFNDLYDQRCVLFAALVNSYPHMSWKSRKHEDGENCFGGGWFVVCINTPEGPYSYHYEDKHWDMFHCKELVVAEKFDGHTDKDVKRLLSICESDSNMLRWAEKEVRIACEFEKKDAEYPEDWDYGCACYESALRAFKSLTRDGHSGFSIMMTKHILTRLIDGKPLRPIEDTDDVWSGGSDISGHKGEFVKYQNKRMSSLFKYVYANGKVKYRDVDNSYCVDISNPDSTYHSGLVQDLIDEMFPISMPYMPGDPIKVYREDFLVDPKFGDYDTIGVLYCIKDDERIELNRFFKETEEGWKEIDRDEYVGRKFQADAERI